MEITNELGAVMTRLYMTIQFSNFSRIIVSTKNLIEQRKNKTRKNRKNNVSL